MPVIVGKLHRIVKSRAGHEGKIVRVLGYAGPPGFAGTENGPFENRYYIDKELETVNRFGPSGVKINHAGEDQLEPILDDDSRDVVSWEDMKDIWIPDKIREAA